MIGFGLGLFLDGRVFGHDGILRGQGRKLNYGLCDDENVMMDGLVMVKRDSSEW